MMFGEAMDWKKWFWERNEATWDRAIRVVAGLVLYYVFLSGYVSGWISYIILLLSVIGIVTGLIGHCLIYVLLGIKTSE